MSQDSINKIKAGTVEKMNFTEVFHELKQPAKLPSKMTEGLTVPLALLALLHLCNEQGCIFILFTSSLLTDRQYNHKYNRPINQT